MRAVRCSTLSNFAAVALFISPCSSSFTQIAVNLECSSSVIPLVIPSTISSVMSGRTFGHVEDIIVRQQVASKLKLIYIWRKQASRASIYSVFAQPRASLRLPWQVTGKLNHAQIGMYFMYLGAVAGSSGLMRLRATASFINLDILPDEDSFSPNRSLKELFVNCSPCTCLMQA